MRRKPVKIYHAYRGNRRRTRRWPLVLGVIAAVLAAVLIAAGLLFRQEVGILSSLRRLDTGAYLMEVRGDYHFEEFLAAGGAHSDQEVSAFLLEKISKGFYDADHTAVLTAHRGCSVLSAVGADGAHLWGRNYDWTGAVPIIVRHVPKEGYASLSTCDFQNITGSSEALPEGTVNRLKAIAALYVPLDGVNEAGLCVADLEVNEGGMPDPDTEKPDLTITTAIRLLLDRAATVEEALSLLEQYDIHPSGEISHHLAISDSGGVSVAVEFTEDGFTAVPTEAVTNFNLANADPSAGGESAQQRYETLTALPALSTADQVRDAMAAVAQTEGAWPTQWSLVYSSLEPFVTWYWDGDFTRGVSLPILPEGNR